MSRHLKKSYSDLGEGKSDNSATLTFTLPDVELTEEQIDSIRQESVKAALKAVEPYRKAGPSGSVTALIDIPRPGDPFSTFSTFSNFASAAGRNVAGD